MGKFSDSDWRPEIVEVFVETVFFWIARIGPLWHDTPEAYERWHRMYVRYSC